MEKYTKELITEEIKKNPKQIIGIKLSDIWTLEGEIGEIKELEETDFTITTDEGDKKFNYEDVKYIDDPRRMKH